MSDEQDPEKLSKEELEKVQGGITLDNGIKRKGVWAPDRDGGSVLAGNAGIEGGVTQREEIGIRKKT